MKRTRLSLFTLDDRCLPSGVPTSWSIRGSGGGGALFSPQINPANPNEYAIASDMSQVFHSVNAGTTWLPIDFRELQGGHESRIQFTNNNDIRYALDYSFDLVTPTKTTNAGTTWTPMTSDPTGGEAIYLLADPGNANRLVVTDYNSLYYSGDGGATWSNRYTAPNDGAGILLGGAFWDGTNIYLGTNRGILRSTNGGASFTPMTLGGVPTDQSIVSFAGGKSGGVTRFVAVTYPTGDVYAGMPTYENFGGGGALTLTLGDANWAVETLPAGTYPFFAGMATNDITKLYVAGGSDADKPTVIKSSDGGGTWQNALLTTNNANVQTGWSGHAGDRQWTYGELALGFTVDSSNPNRLIITDYGFAHASTDGGLTWKALYVNPADLNPANANTPTGRSYRDSGLDNTTAWQVVWPGNNMMLIANSDVRGQRSTDGGQSFGFGYTGHGQNSMYRIAQAANGTLYAATSTVHDLYQSTYLTDSKIDGGDGTVLASVDQGATWTLVHDFNHVVAWVAVDPSNPNRLYASVAHSVDGGIYVTNNLSAGAASTWTKLTNPLRTQGHAFNIVVLNDGTLVASYSGRRTTAFTNSSGVFVSTNGGASWIDRSAAGMIYWTKDVVIDPHDPSQNTWYAGVFSGWGGAPNGLGGLYKTTDRGVSWTRLIALDRVTSATFNPADASELFITTEVDGLWFSTNIDTPSPTFTQVASYKFRQPERVFFNPSNANEVWVTSFGGGVMVGTNNPQAPTTQINQGNAQRSRVTSITVNFPTPVNTATLAAPGAITLTRTTGVAAFVQTGAIGANGRILMTPASGTVSSITLTFDNASGTAVTAGVENGSLTDGRWQLAIPSQSLTASLHRLFGDADGNALIDGTDFAAFGAGFGATLPNSPFDFDNNGFLDGTDLAAFGTRFGMTL